MGWTNKAVTSSFWLVMQEHAQQRGKRLVALRKDRDWTSEQLAQEAGLSYKTISRLENGDVEEPRRNTIKKLASALKVTEAAITGERPSSMDIEQTASQLDRIEKMLEELLALAKDSSDGGAPPLPGETGRRLPKGPTSPPNQRRPGTRKAQDGKPDTGQ